MSAPTLAAEAEPAPAGADPSPNGAVPRPGGRLRRWAWPLSAAALVAVAALATALLTPDGNRDALDPRSTGSTGSRAVAQILRAHGVRVELARTSGEAVAGTGADDAIVVVHPGLLGPAQLDRLDATPAELVLVGPDLTPLRRLAPGVLPAGTGAALPATPECSDPDALAAGTTTGGGSLYRLDGTPGTACYPDAGAPGAGSFVRISARGHRVTVIGQPAVLQNAALTTEGNAALALRALGVRPALRWYLPDPLETGPAAAPTPGQLLPRWVRWVFWYLVVTVVVALVWRGRRLGPVVTEPLPVVVRSAETVEGRARLYRAARSRERAAAILRTATLRRLGTRLGLPTAVPPQEVARLAAVAARRDPAAVRAHLLGPSPTDDLRLVALAIALDGIENSIGERPAGYGGARPEDRPDDRPGVAGPGLPGTSQGEDPRA